MTTANNYTLGFIGIGLMGKPLTLRLLAAGFRVYVWNRSPEKLAEVLAAGAIACATVSELVAAADVVCIFCTHVKHDDAQTKLHVQDSILVFDDSKKHRAFNNTSAEERIVLIIDMMRPPDMPLGTAVGGHTDELDGFMSYFK